MASIDKIQVQGSAYDIIAASAKDYTSNGSIKTALDGKVPTGRKVNGKALSADITLNAANVSAISTTASGAANGVATLDANGKVPTGQLPDNVSVSGENGISASAAGNTYYLGMTDEYKNYYSPYGQPPTVGKLYVVQPRYPNQIEVVISGQREGVDTAYNLGLLVPTASSYSAKRVLIAQSGQMADVLWQELDTLYNVGTDLKLENGIISVNTDGTVSNSAEMSFVAGSGTSASGAGAAAFGVSSYAKEVGALAEGHKTSALGWASHTEGSGTIASRQFSHAEGFGTKADGNGSHAEGWSAQALAAGSHSEGLETKTIGEISHAEGNATSACGYASHSEGESNIASGNYSHAEGWGTYTEGEASHTEGHSTSAIGDRSHAGGYKTIVSGDNTFAHGDNNSANGKHSFVIGVQNKIGTTNFSQGVHSNYLIGESNYIDGVAANYAANNYQNYLLGETNVIGTNTAIRNFVFGAGNSLYTDTTESIKGGYVLGHGNKIRAGGNSFSYTIDSKDNIIVGIVNSAIGIQNGFVGGSGSLIVALKVDTADIGGAEDVLAYSARAYNMPSFAYGLNVSAKGGAIAMGIGSFATIEQNKWSITDARHGYDTSYGTEWYGGNDNYYQPVGHNGGGVAIGSYVSAFNAGSFACGLSGLALAPASFVAGKGNTATHYGEAIVGKYADGYTTYNNNNALFVVGDGTGSTNTHNAFVIYEGGLVSAGGPFVSPYINQNARNIAFWCDGDNARTPDFSINASSVGGEGSVYTPWSIRTDKNLSVGGDVYINGSAKIGNGALTGNELIIDFGNSANQDATVTSTQKAALVFSGKNAGNANVSAALGFSYYNGPMRYGSTATNVGNCQGWFNFSVSDGGASGVGVMSDVFSATSGSFNFINTDKTDDGNIDYHVLWINNSTTTPQYHHLWVSDNYRWNPGAKRLKVPNISATNISADDLVHKGIIVGNSGPGTGTSNEYGPNITAYWVKQYSVTAVPAGKTIAVSPTFSFKRTGTVNAIYCTFELGLGTKSITNGSASAASLTGVESPASNVRNQAVAVYFGPTGNEQRELLSPTYYWTNTGTSQVTAYINIIKAQNKSGMSCGTRAINFMVI